MFELVHSSKQKETTQKSFWIPLLGLIGLINALCSAHFFPCIAMFNSELVDYLLFFLHKRECYILKLLLDIRTSSWHFAKGADI